MPVIYWGPNNWGALTTGTALANSLMNVPPWVDGVGPS
jgi:hypothetical protein